MILNLGGILLGEELEYLSDVHLEISEGRIVHLGLGPSPQSGALSLKNCIAMPSFINSHIHILDYAFPEYDVGLELHEAVAEPYGLKHRLLQNLSEVEVRKVARIVLKKLLSLGVTLAIIYLELLRHADVVKEEAEAVGMEAIVLSRPRRDLSDLEALIKQKHVDGLGLDSPLRYNIEQLSLLNRAFKPYGKTISTHVAETKLNRERGDLDLALNYLDSDLLIHSVYVSSEDLETLARGGRTVALCPRSNITFSVGLPPIVEMMKHGVNLTLGTDNAGIVEPDMWRELEVAYGIARLQGGPKVNVKELLKMATINPLKIASLKDRVDNVVEEGRVANFIVIDMEESVLKDSREIYASIIRRSSSQRVVYVFRKGSMVYGSIEAR